MPSPPPSTPPAHNLELKVHCNHNRLAEIEALAVKAGVGPFRRLRHRDHYFVVPSGRLKLRDIESEDGTKRAELIAYARPDTAAARWSAYRRVPLPSDVAAETRDVLAMALGVLAVVEKERRVAIHRRTRIHLDRVRDLGDFVELETVVDCPDDETATIELDAVVALLGLDACETIAGSYADLMLAARPRGGREEGFG